MWLVLIAILVSPLLSQSPKVHGYLRIEPKKFPAGINYFNTGKRGDVLLWDTMTLLRRSVEEGKILEWVGSDQIFFVVSRLDQSQPVKVEVIYRRQWQGQSCVYGFFILTAKGSDIESDLKGVVERVKSFPKTGPPPTSRPSFAPTRTSAGLVKSAVPNGTALFCLKNYFIRE